MQTQANFDKLPQTLQYLLNKGCLEWYREVVKGNNKGKLVQTQANFDKLPQT